MSLKSECLKFRIVDYISKGGISGLLNYPEIKNALLPTADEYWKDGENTVYTFDFDYYSIDLITGKNNNLLSDQLEFYIESVYASHIDDKDWIINNTEINFLDQFLEELVDREFIEEVLTDGEEVVFFLNNGINIHFTKYLESTFLIKKIISNNYLTSQNRELIKANFKEYDHKLF